MCTITHILVVIGEDVIRLPSQNVQCHSLPASGHRKRCDQTSASHKICNVTHILLVIGKDVIRLPFTKCAMSVTFVRQLRNSRS